MSIADSEAWKQTVLRSMPPPAWLGAEAPDGDVVISSRSRYARNLAGHRFPNAATSQELGEVQRLIEAAANEALTGAECHKQLTGPEHEFLLGSRLISADFPYQEITRSVTLDDTHLLSAMVNEEDHLRLQAVTAGWSIKTADLAATTALQTMTKRLRFAHRDDWGYLTASPANVGLARRWSALFHLIGLGQTGKLTTVLKALSAWGIVTRGLYGESSKAVGAFFQISATAGTMSDLIGAGKYLIAQERAARKEITRSELSDRLQRARDFARSNASIGRADALRALGWVRWAATESMPGAPTSPRIVDLWTSTMEVHGATDAEVAAKRRAVFLSDRLNPS